VKKNSKNFQIDRRKVDAAAYHTRAAQKLPMKLRADMKTKVVLTLTFLAVAAPAMTFAQSADRPQRACHGQSAQNRANAQQKVNAQHKANGQHKVNGQTFQGW